MVMSTTTPIQDDDVLLSPEAGGRLLGRKREWMLEHSTGGKKPRLPYVRFGRFVHFSRKALREIIEKHSVNG